jgi:hypothetical protein
MVATARTLDPHLLVQEMAAVLERNEDGYLVGTSSGRYRARRAVSCVVEPAVDDVVLVASSSRGECYLLAVLEREGDKTRIVADGDLEIDVRSGRFTVAAGRGVGIVSSQDVSITSAELAVRAVSGNVVLDRLSFFGRYLQSEVERVKMLAGTVDQLLDRFSQRVKRSYRTVEQLERLRAGEVDYEAKQTMSLHGDNTAMTANKLVKVDGEQIHVG